MTAGVEPGAFIRRRGEDVRAGTRVLEPSRRLGPAQIAMSAAVGLGSVRVHRRPVAGVLSTGDELRRAGQPARRRRASPTRTGPACWRCAATRARWRVDLGIAGDSLESVLAPCDRRSSARTC